MPRRSGGRRSGGRRVGGGSRFRRRGFHHHHSSFGSSYHHGHHNHHYSRNSSCIGLPLTFAIIVWIGLCTLSCLYLHFAHVFPCSLNGSLDSWRSVCFRSTHACLLPLCAPLNSSITQANTSSAFDDDDDDDCFLGNKTVS